MYSQNNKYAELHAVASYAASLNTIGADKGFMRRPVANLDSYKGPKDLIG